MFAILTAVTMALGLTLIEPPYPKGDSFRYINHATTLKAHGVFAYSGELKATPPAPGNMYTPAYPAWLAFFMHIDDDVRNSLLCISRNMSKGQPCAATLQSLAAGQLFLEGVFLFVVWAVAKRLTGNVAVGWLAVAFALISRIPFKVGTIVLTEALLLPAMALFVLFALMAYQDRRPRWLLPAGLALGVAALTRPAYLYLFYGALVPLIAIALFRERRRLLASAFLLSVGFAVVAGPWMIRNKIHFDSVSLTSAHAADILVQRVAYNRMSWTEFGVSFLYWFPDFGDSLAAAVFPEPYYAKLGWDEDTYYGTEASRLYDEIKAEVPDKKRILSHLLGREVLGNPVKHLLVTFPLAWRAIFVAKYWGILGAVCFTAMLIVRLRNRRHDLLIASLPIWFMVGFHAFVSVSIPRYNLALAVIYAAAMAWAAHALALGAARRWQDFRRAGLGARRFGAAADPQSADGTGHGPSTAARADLKFRSTANRPRRNISPPKPR